MTLPVLNQTLNISDASYTVRDIKNARCLGVEGELPRIAYPSREYEMYDLVAPGARFASIEIDSDGSFHVFTGFYVQFADLKFSNLRELPGWKLD